MQICQTEINDLFLIKNFKSVDDRGVFVKTFNKDDFLFSKLDFNIIESYFSINNKDVIRGMHFQLPPFDHDKLVYVTSGAIIDVVIDLRKNSTSFMKVFSVKLDSTSHDSVFIPKGCAHGFRSLVDNTVTVYNVSSVYNSNFDSGISYDSFGYNWMISNPIVSERDKLLLNLDDFSIDNPF